MEDSDKESHVVSEDNERLRKAFEVQSLLELNNKRSTWATCFAVVTFDLELGQIITSELEHSFPPVKFSDKEASNISFSAFPDSNSNLSGDVIYAFRHKKIRDDEDPNKPPSYFYGYVFFRQEKDASIRRGYLQKSVVLISDYPYFGLFKKVISLVGPLFFEFGDPLLEASYQNLASWPILRSGKSYELPFLGTVLSFHVPYSSSPHIIDPRLNKKISGSKEQLVSNLDAINLFKCFNGIINKLWLLWELMLLGEPVLVLSHSPPECSEAVLALISLISPLTYGGDFRPFFTIHDTDFKDYTASVQDLPPVVLGVTNPFFCKALEHWPHICSVGSPPEKKGSKRGSVKLVSDFKQEVKSKYKHLASVDKDEILDQLDLKSGTPQSVAANNEILRKHFLSLTENFLVPLERYFSQLMPLAKDISIFRKPPRLKIFDEQDFLNLVANSPKKGPLGGKLEELYSRFIHSVNFRLWFNARRKEAFAKLNSLYQNALMESDMRKLLEGRKEVEIIDLMIRIQEQIEIASRKNQSDIVNKLEEHVVVLVNILPPDLQVSIQRQEDAKQIFKIEDPDSL